MKYWPIVFAVIVFVHTTGFTSAIAATEFKCEQVHGGPSIVRLGRDKTVEYKKLPIGEWTKAQVLDKGNGWVTFKDGYGFVDEETTKGQDDSNCKKSVTPCHDLIKFFEFNEESIFGFKLTSFTSSTCCPFGEDKEAGDEAEYEYCRKY